jgi:hypothetical protein
MRWIAPFLVAICAVAASKPCPATIYAYSATDKPSNGPDANHNTDVWTVSTNGDTPVANGDSDLIGNSGTNGLNGASGAGAGDMAWGIHLNDTSQVRARASITDLIGRPLSNPGESVAIDFDHGLVGDGIVAVTFHSNPDQGNESGFVLFSGDTHYSIVDAHQDADVTPVAETYDGFNLKLTLLDPGTYELDVDKHDMQPYNSGTRTLLSGISSLATIDIEAFGLGDATTPGTGPDYTVFFNNLVITTVPEASSAAMAASALATIGLASWSGRRRPGQACRRSPRPAKTPRPLAPPSHTTA